MLEECSNVCWSDAYLLGNTVVDEEHKQLFCLIEKLFHCSGNEQEVLAILKELIKYTKFHFAHEEQFMKSINFPYFNDHKQLHKDIVDKLEKIIQKKGELQLEEFAKKLALFIKENIVAHILIEDKKLNHYANNRLKLKNIFQWKDTYSINHKEIDSEHKKLFVIALKALDTPKNGKKKYIRKTLIELNKYMREHFRNEEKFMCSINYPGYEAHKRIHNEIIEQINIIIKKIPTLLIEDFEKILIEYMDIWLINHILTEDSKIVCFQKSLQ